MATDDDTYSQDTGHPVLAGVRALGAAVGDVSGLALFGLDATTTRETLVELAGARAGLDALTLAVAAHTAGREQATRRRVPATGG